MLQTCVAPGVSITASVDCAPFGAGSAIASRMKSRQICAGKAPPRDAVHWRAVIIAHPYAGDERFREANEPGIAIVLAGAGLAGRKRAGVGPTSSATLDHQLQQAEEIGLVGGKVDIRPYL